MGRIAPVRFTAQALKEMESAVAANQLSVSEWIRSTTMPLPEQIRTLPVFGDNDSGRPWAVPLSEERNGAGSTT